MPYQVRAGSFLVVAPTLGEAIKLHDDMKNHPDGISVRDMDGIEVDVERLRTILNEGEPN